MIRFYFFILLISINLYANEQNGNTQNLDYFKSIPEGDQKAIKLLFRDLFFEQGFSYSLFGDKPMSLSRKTLNNYSSDELVKLLSIDGYCQCLLKPYSDPSNSLQQRWDIWKKHESGFKIKNYYLLKKPINSQIHLIFINIKTFTRVIADNIDLFRKVTQSYFSIDSFLAEMSSEDKDIFDILDNNEGLLGIMLGFGRHNSMLFQKREHLFNILGKGLQDPRLIYDKIEILDSKLQSLHKYDPYIVTALNRVGFAADPNHKETVVLRDKYDELYIKINKIQSEDDWFEQTLLLLRSD